MHSASFQTYPGRLQNLPCMGLFMAVLITAGVMSGCDPAEPAASSPPAMQSASTSLPTAASDTSAQARQVRIVFLGDSLTAGYGLETSQAFPAILEAKLKAANLPVAIVNAGVSGDTTAGGLRRLDWLLKQSPDIVVVGLGGNDGLRGLDMKDSENNLRQIIQKCKAANARVLLLGMLIPPNYGPQYTAEFRELYPKLAKELDVALLPFLLEGVGGDPQLNLPDGIHPNAQGHQIVADHVLPVLEPVVQAVLEKE